MNLPTIYSPLVKLKGFVLWNMDKKHEIYYFYYKIQLPKNHLRLFVYIFQNNDFSGVEYILDHSGRNTHEAKQIIENYKKEAVSVVKRRERIRNLFD